MKRAFIVDMRRPRSAGIELHTCDANICVVHDCLRTHARVAAALSTLLGQRGRRTKSEHRNANERLGHDINLRTAKRPPSHFYNGGLFVCLYLVVVNPLSASQEPAGRTSTRQ